MIMRYIGSFILLLCFLCLRANAQGLEFNTYESETIQKTSYSVFDENPLTPISYTHRVIAQNLNDAFTQSGRGLGVSYNQNKFYFRIDNILISKNLQSYNCTVDQSIKESDHYPIWCYIAKRQ